MIRRLILIVFAVLLPASALIAETPAESFGKGIAAYKAGDYPEAIRQFLAIEQEGYDSFAVTYNLGNSYYKNGNLGKAILYYERTLLHHPGNEDVVQNLNIARARIRDRVDPMPLLFFVRWWNDLQSSFRPESIFYASFLFLCIVAAALFVFFGFQRLFLRRAALSVVAVFGVLFVLSVVLYTARLDDYRSHRFAVVMPSKVTVLSTPDASAVESFNIHEGLKVEILDSEKEFYHIRLLDGKNGWVHRDVIERI